MIIEYILFVNESHNHSFLATTFMKDLLEEMSNDLESL